MFLPVLSLDVFGQSVFDWGESGAVTRSVVSSVLSRTPPVGTCPGSEPRIGADTKGGGISPGRPILDRADDTP